MNSSSMISVKHWDQATCGRGVLPRETALTGWEVTRSQGIKLLKEVCVSLKTPRCCWCQSHEITAKENCIQGVEPAWGRDTCHRQQIGMVEPSKLYEAKISATKHGATEFGICWDSVLLCLIQYFLTAPVPPCWNRNTYYVPLYVGYNWFVYLFSRGITVEGLLWVSVETLVFGLLNNFDWWCLWRLLKLKKMHCFSSQYGHESTENRELNVAIQMKNVPYRLTFLNSWHHFRVREDKVFQPNRTRKQAGIAILISDEISCSLRPQSTKGIS